MGMGKETNWWGWGEKLVPMQLSTWTPHFPNPVSANSTQMVVPKAHTKCNAKMQ